MPKYRIAVFVVLSTLIACKKEERHLDVDADVVSAFTFPQGSYWIFKHAATGSPDSLAMRSFSSRTDIISMDYRTTTYSTWHFSELHEYLDGTDTALWQFQMLNDGDRVGAGLLVKYDPYRASILTGSFSPVFARPVTGRYTNPLSNETSDMELLPSLTVNGRQYGQVYHTRYFSKTNQPDEEMYLNLTVGIIKVVQHSLGFHRTLELVRWHVPR